MNQKEFIPYEQALELRGLGFDEDCVGYYAPEMDGKYYLFTSSTDNTYDMEKHNPNVCPAPLYQQAFRFFREKYGLHSEIRYVDDVLSYSYLVTKIKTNTELEEKFRFTYEEAQDACILKLIELAKQK